MSSEDNQIERKNDKEVDEEAEKKVRILTSTNSSKSLYLLHYRNCRILNKFFSSSAMSSVKGSRTMA